jgi:hypothetical protein
VDKTEKLPQEIARKSNLCSYVKRLWKECALNLFLGHIKRIYVQRGTRDESYEKQLR